MIIQRRILTLLAPSILATFLAVGLLSSPAHAAAKKPTSKVTQFGLYKDNQGIGAFFIINHTGGPIMKSKICWESTSYCVGLRKAVMGNQVSSYDWKVAAKIGQTHKAVLYYTIDGYNFKHVLKAVVDKW